MFITIEGIEGSGKSTLLGIIRNFLAQNDIDFCATREPGGTKIAEKVRQILLEDHDEALHPDTELFLMFSSRIQHIHQVVLPNLDQGRVVISDRFVDASYAYQGAGRQVGFEPIDMICNQFIPKRALPNMTFFMKAPIELCLERMRQRGQLDRIEKESVSFFERVYQGYQDKIARSPERYTCVDATLTLDEITLNVEKILQEKMRIK